MTGRLERASLWEKLVTGKEKLLQKTEMLGKKSDASGGGLQTLLGRAVEDLSLTERLKYAGTWVAFRIYAPPHKVSREGIEYVDVRLRRIEAYGESMAECAAQLRSRNLDAPDFEFIPLKPPY